MAPSPLADMAHALPGARLPSHQSRLPPLAAPAAAAAASMLSSLNALEASAASGSAGDAKKSFVAAVGAFKGWAVAACGSTSAAGSFGMPSEH